MPIPVSCKCGQGFRAKDELAGKKVKCPKCGQVLQIPGINPSDSVASASGLLSIDDLMKMDAAAPSMPQNMPGMQGMAGTGAPQQGMPAPFQQPAGYAAPGGGGFQTPNPFFAQAGARPKSSSGGRGFMIAMASLGGVTVLAIIAMVIIVVFRGGSDTTNVTSGGPMQSGPGMMGGGPGPGGGPGSTTSAGGPGQGTTTPGTTTNPVGGSAAGTSTTPLAPQSYAHAGFDNPDAALTGFFDSLQKE